MLPTASVAVIALAILCVNAEPRPTRAEASCIALSFCALREHRHKQLGSGGVGDRPADHNLGCHSISFPELSVVSWACNQNAGSFDALTLPGCTGFFTIRYPR